MKLNLEQKAVTVNTNKEIGNREGEVLGIPAGQFQKNGRFGRGKKKQTKPNLILGKINAQKGKGKETQQTDEKQGTEFSAIYRNQIQVPKFDLVGRNRKEKKTKPKPN